MTTAFSPSSGTLNTSRAEAIQPWLVVFSAACFFFFNFIQVNMFNALNPYLFKAFHLSDNVQLGHLSANYFYATVLFLLPAGVLLDRFSTRKIIIMALSTTVISTLLFAFAQQLWQAEICRFVTGIAGAFSLISCVRLASRWFPARRMALVIGLVVTFAMLGAMVAQTPFVLMAEHWGWRHTLLYDGVFGVGLLLLVLFFVKDFPSNMGAAVQAGHAQLYTDGILQSLWAALRNRQNWLAGIYASAINIPVFLLGNWGVMYLHQIHHIARDSASVITMMMFVGLTIGSPVFGWVSDQLQHRCLPMIWGAVLSMIVVLIIMFWHSAGYWDMWCLFFLLGFAISAQIIAYPLVAESNPESLTGAAEGIASVLIMSGGFLVPVFTRLLDLDWHQTFSQGFPLYPLSAYHLAFSLMPIAFGIGFCVVLLMKETHGRAYSERQDHASSGE